jgi:AcrR family transcriptional regulator
MATPGSVGKRDTGTREKIMTATLDIMVEEGYASATSRRIAEKVGVQRAVVYYYFPTMDDLFLAVLRRGTQENLATQRRALSSKRPLHALWDMTIDPRGARILIEFMALSNHRKVIREELAAGAERFREAQVAALSFMLGGHPNPGPLTPEVVSVLISVIGRSIGLEKSLHITTGHDQTLPLIQQYLDRLETTTRGTSRSTRGQSTTASGDDFN